MCRQRLCLHLITSFLFVMTSTPLNAVQTVRFYRDDVDDLQFLNDLLFVKVTKSRLYCAQFCALTERCVTFTFIKFKTSGICRGHGVAMGMGSKAAASRSNNVTTVRRNHAVPFPGARTYHTVTRTEAVSPCSTLPPSPIPWTTPNSIPTSSPSSSLTTSSSPTETTIYPFSKWVRSPCSETRDCPTDAGSVCYYGQCLCPPGQYYFLSQGKCSSSCETANLSNSVFLGPYPHTDLSGQFQGLYNGQNTLDSCLALCLSFHDCRAVDYAPEKEWCDLLRSDATYPNTSINSSNPMYQYYHRACQ